MRLAFFFVFLAFSACTINIPESEVGVEPQDDSKIDSETKTPRENPDIQDDELSSVGDDDIDDRSAPAMLPPPSSQSYDTVCSSAIPAGMMDMAIQKGGHFYETAGKIILRARTKLSSDEDTAERLMYGPNMRMWVRIPELIRTVEGRGSPEIELCLTVGNINCRYIWGAKVFELDFCDFGVQPEDILGARFFSLEVHNSDLAPDAMVRAELKAISPVR